MKKYTYNKKKAIFRIFSAYGIITYKGSVATRQYNKKRNKKIILITG